MNDNVRTVRTDAYRKFAQTYRIERRDYEWNAYCEQFEIKRVDGFIDPNPYTRTTPKIMHTVLVTRIDDAVKNKSLLQAARDAAAMLARNERQADGGKQGCLANYVLSLTKRYEVTCISPNADLTARYVVFDLLDPLAQQPALVYASALAQVDPILADALDAYTKLAIDRNAQRATTSTGQPIHTGHHDKSKQ